MNAEISKEQEAFIRRQAVRDFVYFLEQNSEFISYRDPVKQPVIAVLWEAADCFNNGPIAEVKHE